MTSRVWLLLSGGESEAIAAPLNAFIGLSTRGQALRRVDVADASADIIASARRGAEQAYNLLYREKYLDRRVAVRFEAGVALQNVHGQSADLAFAFAFAATVCGRAMASIAASGQLDVDGAILSVGDVPAKLETTLVSAAPQAFVVLPRGNEADVPDALRRRAAAAGVKLVFAARIEDAFQAAGIALSQTWRESPFRGLQSFGFEHAAIFFGRDQEVENLLELLARECEKPRTSVLIEGPSGSGKSSLALAGLMPALMRRGIGSTPGEAIRWGALRPWRMALDPAALWGHAHQGAIRAKPPPLAAFHDPEAHMAWLKEQGAENARFVLVLDQLDDWFAPGADEDVAKRAGEFALGMLERGVWLIGTATTAVRDRIAKHAFGQCFGIEGRYALPAGLDGPRLDAIIHGPAHAARLAFEPGLAAEMFKRVSAAGEDVLPVLELLLTEIYERRDTSKNLLRMADYRAVGGLDGVVSARAEAAFQEADDEARAAMDELLWRLTSAGMLLDADFAPGAPVLVLARTFQDARLLVGEEIAPGGTAYRVAHEALLRLWPRAVSYRASHDAALRRWADLAREAAQWRRGERALIPPGPQLDAAIALDAARADAWTASDLPTLDYVRASAGQQTRRRTMRRLLVGAPAAVALGAGAIGAAGWLSQLTRTRIDFEDVPVPPPDFAVAAAPYLQRFGIYVEQRQPDSAHLLIKSNSGLYDGQAASPYSGQHFLAQEANPATAPISYVLRFDPPPTSIYLTRAGLWAASDNGVSHPAWNAVARDASDAEIARAAEATSAVFHRDERIRPRAFALTPAVSARIARVEITSDFRDEHGKPYAAFQSVLLKEIMLER